MVPGVKKGLLSKIVIGEVHIPVEDLLHKYSTPKYYVIQAKHKVTGTGQTKEELRNTGEIRLNGHPIPIEKIRGQPEEQAMSLALINSEKHSKNQEK